MKGNQIFRLIRWNSQYFGLREEDTGNLHFYFSGEFFRSEKKLFCFDLGFDAQRNLLMIISQPFNKEA